VRELEKAIAGGLAPDAAAPWLARCRETLAAWSVALPPAPPLVSDFGLGEFAKTGLIEFWIANEEAAGYCAKYLFVFDGQSCPMHAHGRKHETFFLVRGRVRLTHRGGAVTLEPGAVVPVAPGEVHGFTGLGPALLLEASTPCRVADNRFEDPRIRKTPEEPDAAGKRPNERETP
jgi:D-lyxose ketol-isomerase